MKNFNNWIKESNDEKNVKDLLSNSTTTTSVKDKNSVFDI